MAISKQAPKEFAITKEVEASLRLDGEVCSLTSSGNRTEERDGATSTNSGSQQSEEGVGELGRVTESVTGTVHVPADEEHGSQIR